MHSSHDLDRPEATRFRVKLTYLNIPKIDLVEVLIDLLEAENLKSKNLADEYTAFMPAYVAAVVHFPEHKSMLVNELDRISRQQHRTWLINATWSGIFQSLVRSFVIEDLSKTIELLLLQPQR
jgi:hypothetical protein